MADEAGETKGWVVFADCIAVPADVAAQIMKEFVAVERDYGAHSGSGNNRLKIVDNQIPMTVISGESMTIMRAKHKVMASIMSEREHAEYGGDVAAKAVMDPAMYKLQLEQKRKLMQMDAEAKQEISKALGDYYGHKK